MTDRRESYIADLASAELGAWDWAVDDNCNAIVSLTPEPNAVLWKV